MAASPESNQGQTRAELLQTTWKAALAAGVAQTLLAPSAFAEVNRHDAYNMHGNDISGVKKIGADRETSSAIVRQLLTPSDDLLRAYLRPRASLKPNHHLSRLDRLIILPSAGEQHTCNHVVHRPD